MKPIIKGRIAIVIDDWGYHLDNLAIAGGIKQRLTCAVLPGLRNSREAAQYLHKSGHEVILHLPMEPKGKLRLEKDTIAVNMAQQEVRRILDKDLGEIVFAKGVSNHMGSRLTEDIKQCEIILLEVKKRKLYFLDSFVTAKSVCGRLAKKIGVKFAKRDVFLDNRNEAEYIKAQVRSLKNLAQVRGIAVGIGHDRKNTLLVLKEMLPQLVKEGYQFVFVSEIARVDK
ncbi:MAG: divergent polysaccharide deacetylase family protein [Candidatus Omnitrophica bacterium]|nr:divergent polysaccharide deacetylase family protein [Candidatus Omnitrophota bacterium]